MGLFRRVRLRGAVGVQNVVEAGCTVSRRFDQEGQCECIGCISVQDA